MIKMAELENKAVIKFSLFDSGIRFNFQNLSAKDFFTNKIKSIKVSAALDNYSRAFIAFGISKKIIGDDSGANGKDSLSGNHNLFNYVEKIGRLWKIPSVETCEDSLISFFPYYISDGLNQDENNKTFNPHFYRLYVKSINGNTIEENYKNVKTIQTPIYYYPQQYHAGGSTTNIKNDGDEQTFYRLKFIESKYEGIDPRTPYIENDEDREIIHNIAYTCYKPSFDSARSMPSLIPLNELATINENHEMFFSRLGDFISNLQYSEKNESTNEYEFFDLTADMIRIYIGLCTVYPDNKLDTDPFPMSTIENISVEFN